MRNESGFSLVEVLTALIILGIAVIGLSLCLESTIGFQERNKNQTILPLLAREKMESILTGDERAEEGDFPQPWQTIHWRLYREYSPEGLAVMTLRLTRRDRVDKTIFSLSATRLEKDRD